MATKTDRRAAWLALAFVCSACAVEVGNPRGGDASKGGTGKSGKLTISLVGDATDAAQQVYLDIEKLELRGSDDSADKTATLELDSKDRVGLASDSSASTVLATKRDVAIGSYESIILTLRDGTKTAVVLNDGSEHPLQLVGDSKNAIVVDNAIDVAEGDDTELALRLDLRHSLTLPAGAEVPPGALAFNPTMTPLARPRAAIIKGTTADDQGRFVCAYLFEPLPPPPPPPGMKGKRPPPPPPPPRGVSANQSPVFATEDSVVKDTTTECPNAWAVAAVKDQSFTLTYLRPGKYSLRIFWADGSYADPLAAISAMPGQTAEVLVPAKN